MASTMTTSEWIAVSIQIASLMATLWFGVSSIRLQRAQISAARAAEKAAEEPIIQRWRWFKAHGGGFAVMVLLSLGWLVFAGLQADPVTRATLLQFSLLTMWCLVSAFMVGVFAFVAAFVPIGWIQGRV